MATSPKIGPLLPADFQAIWESTTDPLYWQPLEQAGEGNGFEVHTQAWQQFARVSEAVDDTTQGLFILPWSGQSAPPASGARSATVELTLTRTLRLELPLVLQAGTVVEEQATDWGPSGGVPVLTGRQYALSETVVFEPGMQGPITAEATATRPGEGHNNPLPGTLTAVPQPGTGYENGGATVRGQSYPGIVDPQTIELVFCDCANEADSFIPQHVGQYLLFTAGANEGTVARIAGYSPPNLSATPATGGTVQLELWQSARCYSGNYSGEFDVGELLVLADSGTPVGYGRLLDATVDPASGDLLLTWVKLSGAADNPGGTPTSVTGQTSGAAAETDFIFGTVDFTPEAGTAAWQVLDWSGDWGLAVTNAASPAGGRFAMLDALAWERGIRRSSPLEQDSTFAPRVATIADVVSPNAIRRVLNRTLIPEGIGWVFTEAGTTFPGVFYDQDAYDYDAVVVPTGTGTGTFLDGEPVSQTDGTTGWVATGWASVPAGLPGSVPGPPTAGSLYGFLAPRGTFTTGGPMVGMVRGATLTPSSVIPGLPAGTVDKVVFGYENMRAWFYVVVTPSDAGEFGFAYDSYPTGAYDAAPFDDFYDGYPLAYAAQLLTLSRALDNARAGGVGVDLFLGTAAKHDPTATTAVG